jgi:hypothetical protein
LESRARGGIPLIPVAFDRFDPACRFGYRACDRDYLGYPTIDFSTLRYDRWNNIAKGTRHMARNPTRPLTLPGIPT